MPRLLAAQSQAARALLNWSQKDLAIRARLGETTVRAFEQGARAALPRTQFLLWAAYYNAGVRFPEGGVLLSAEQLPPLCTAALSPSGLCGWYMQKMGYCFLDNPFTQDSDFARQWVDGYVRSIQDE